MPALAAKAAMMFVARGMRCHCRFGIDHVELMAGRVLNVGHFAVGSLVVRSDIIKAG